MGIGADGSMGLSAGIWDLRYITMRDRDRGVGTGESLVRPLCVIRV